MSQGCNYLISENRASIFTSVKKIAEVIGWDYLSHSSEPKQKELFGPNSKEKEKILLALESNDRLDIGSLVSLTGISASNLLGHLLELELDGKIASLPGKRYSVL
jgi:DNA processing protein